jgi:hypothetical protein
MDGSGIIYFHEFLSLIARKMKVKLCLSRMLQLSQNEVANI